LALAAQLVLAHIADGIHSSEVEHDSHNIVSKLAEELEEHTVQGMKVERVVSDVVQIIET